MQRSLSLRTVVALCLLALLSASLLAQEPEPILGVGHGAMFDQNGNEIEPTPEFVARAQKYYRAKLLALMTDAKKSEFAKFERQLPANLRADAQTQLVVQQRALDWLIANTPMKDGGRTQSKLSALRYALTWKLQDRKLTGAPAVREPFRLDPNIEKQINLANIGGPIVFLSTVNTGQAYIDECAANGVPIPPAIGVLDPMGTAGWKTQGFIPKTEQFIVKTPAEFRTYQSMSPPGMCVALPRYSDDTKTTVALDGVICLGQTTSKVCVWDNQMSTVTFSFPAGTQIPIGVADLSVDPMGRYQAGGFELLGGAGGICTDCHAGENPYIIHPNSDLGGGVLMGNLNSPPLNLPTFGANRYDPIVASAWPQNALSHSAPLVPPQCIVCHDGPGGFAGRFPHLSTDIPLYCSTILAQALTKTMPPTSPGSLAAHPAIVAFKAWCGSAPSSGPSDRGDPHLTTTNGINYDFQSGGEFTTLRNSSNRFELQTRQSPVSTTFMPGANAYTGLASCVSLNTAAAVRLGKHRVTYQPGPSGGSRMDLRIDGALVDLPMKGIDLGGGNAIAPASSEGALDIRAADGTHVIISPEYWSSQGYWYLNVEVLDTPAREGTMGAILAGNWLPLAPNGTSFGPAPVSIADRHSLLNQKFADAWRVTKKSSLFDYLPGTSTANFTYPDWPPFPGKACVVPAQKPVEPMPRNRAEELCRPVKDKNAFENCVFDVAVTGEAGMAAGYLHTLTLRDDAGALPPADLRRCLALKH